MVSLSNNMELKQLNQRTNTGIFLWALFLVYTLAKKFLLFDSRKKCFSGYESRDLIILTQKPESKKFKGDRLRLSIKFATGCEKMTNNVTLPVSFYFSLFVSMLRISWTQMIKIIVLYWISNLHCSKDLINNKSIPGSSLRSPDLYLITFQGYG